MSPWASRVVIVFAAVTRVAQGKQLDVENSKANTERALEPHISLDIFDEDDDRAVQLENEKLFPEKKEESVFTNILPSRSFLANFEEKRKSSRAGRKTAYRGGESASTGKKLSEEGKNAFDNGFSDGHLIIQSQAAASGKDSDEEQSSSLALVPYFPSFGDFSFSDISSFMEIAKLHSLYPSLQQFTPEFLQPQSQASQQQLQAQTCPQVVSQMVNCADTALSKEVVTKSRVFGRTTKLRGWTWNPGLVPLHNNKENNKGLRQRLDDSCAGHLTPLQGMEMRLTCAKQAFNSCQQNLGYEGCGTNGFPAVAGMLIVGAVKYNNCIDHLWGVVNGLAELQFPWVLQHQYNFCRQQRDLTNHGMQQVIDEVEAAAVSGMHGSGIGDILGGHPHVVPGKSIRILLGSAWNARSDSKGNAFCYSVYVRFQMWGGHAHTHGKPTGSNVVQFFQNKEQLSNTQFQMHTFFDPHSKKSQGIYQSKAPNRGEGLERILNAHDQYEAERCSEISSVLQIPPTHQSLAHSVKSRIKHEAEHNVKSRRNLPRKTTHENILMAGQSMTSADNVKTALDFLFPAKSSPIAAVFQDPAGINSLNSDSKSCPGVAAAIYAEMEDNLFGKPKFYSEGNVQSVGQCNYLLFDTATFGSFTSGPYFQMLDQCNGMTIFEFLANEFDPNIDQGNLEDRRGTLFTTKKTSEYSRSDLRSCFAFYLKHVVAGSGTRAGGKSSKLEMKIPASESVKRVSSNTVLNVFEPENVRNFFGKFSQDSQGGNPTHKPQVNLNQFQNICTTNEFMDMQQAIVEAAEGNRYSRSRNAGEQKLLAKKLIHFLEDRLRAPSQAEQRSFHQKQLWALLLFMVLVVVGQDWLVDKIDNLTKYWKKGVKMITQVISLEGTGLLELAKPGHRSRGRSHRRHS